MAEESMATKTTDCLKNMQQDTQLALENVATATASDRNAVRSLTKTITRLTTELYAANSDTRRL